MRIAAQKKQASKTLLIRNLQLKKLALDGEEFTYRYCGPHREVAET